MYALLKLFDQKSRVKDNEHRLRLIRKFFPGFLDRVINRIQAAAIENYDLEEQMFAEDEYLKTLIRRDNKITLLEDLLDKKDKALEDEKNKAKQFQHDFAKILKENGVSIDVIHKKTGLPIDEIEIM